MSDREPDPRTEPQPSEDDLLEQARKARSTARNGEERGPSGLALPLIFFGDMLNPKPKVWVMKNVVAYGEISSWIGPPGALKSSLLTDLGMHVAEARSWRGYPAGPPVGVVYFALERAGLVARRIAAYCKRDKVQTSLPIAISPRLIDLMNTQCVEIILATIKAAEDRFGCGVGFTIFDTFNKGIAAGGGDEDKARDQNRVNANMRRLLERQDMHIAGIGHTGKDESKGERGSNARLADIDALIRITGDDVKLATIEKANDQAQGRLCTFFLEAVEMGVDEDGDAIETMIISRGSRSAAQKEARKPPGSGEILQRAILDAYGRLADDEGTSSFGFNGKPVIKVKADRLREEVRNRGLLDKNEKGQITSASRESYRRAKAALIDARKLIESKDLIWNPG